MSRGLSQALFSGNVGKDPVVKKGGASPMARFSLAVNEGKDKDGNKVTCWFDIVAWGKQAEYVEKYIHKGDYLVLKTRPHAYTYKNENDETRTMINFRLDEVIFTPSGKKSRQNEEPDDYVDRGGNSSGGIEDEGSLPF